ncbi:MAG: uncharacterized protein KVP18_001401 [Porospora cf. gigantea A]|nr:MAG: hypothetical protein KVP18_001401 [Porospora cf. gigantea A]
MAGISEVVSTYLLPFTRALKDCVIAAPRVAFFEPPAHYMAPCRCQTSLRQLEGVEMEFQPAPATGICHDKPSVALMLTPRDVLLDCLCLVGDPVTILQCAALPGPNSYLSQTCDDTGAARFLNLLALRCEGTLEFTSDLTVQTIPALLANLAAFSDGDGPSIACRAIILRIFQCFVSALDSRVAERPSLLPVLRQASVSVSDTCESLAQAISDPNIVVHAPNADIDVLSLVAGLNIPRPELDMSPGFSTPFFEMLKKRLSSEKHEALERLEVLAVCTLRVADLAATVHLMRTHLDTAPSGKRLDKASEIRRRMHSASPSGILDSEPVYLTVLLHHCAGKLLRQIYETVQGSCYEADLNQEIFIFARDLFQSILKLFTAVHSEYQGSALLSSVVPGLRFIRYLVYSALEDPAFMSALVWQGFRNVFSRRFFVEMTTAVLVTHAEELLLDLDRPFRFRPADADFSPAGERRHPLCVSIRYLVKVIQQFAMSSDLHSSDLQPRHLIQCPLIRDVASTEEFLEAVPPGLNSVSIIAARFLSVLRGTYSPCGYLLVYSLLSGVRQSTSSEWSYFQRLLPFCPFVGIASLSLSCIAIRLSPPVLDDERIEYLNLLLSSDAIAAQVTGLTFLKQLPSETYIPARLTSLIEKLAAISFAPPRPICLEMGLPVSGFRVKDCEHWQDIVSQWTAAAAQVHTQTKVVELAQVLLIRFPSRLYKPRPLLLSLHGMRLDVSAVLDDLLKDAEIRCPASVETALLFPAIQEHGPLPQAVNMLLSHLHPCAVEELPNRLESVKPPSPSPHLMLDSTVPPPDHAARVRLLMEAVSESQLVTADSATLAQLVEAALVLVTWSAMTLQEIVLWLQSLTVRSSVLGTLWKRGASNPGLRTLTCQLVSLVVPATDSLSPLLTSMVESCPEFVILLDQIHLNDVLQWLDDIRPKALLRLQPTDVEQLGDVLAAAVTDTCPEIHSKCFELLLAGVVSTALVRLFDASGPHQLTDEQGETFLDLVRQHLLQVPFEQPERTCEDCISEGMVVCQTFCHFTFDRSAHALESVVLFCRHWLSFLSRERAAVRHHNVKHTLSRFQRVTSDELLLALLQLVAKCVTCPGAIDLLPLVPVLHIGEIGDLSQWLNTKPTAKAMETFETLLSQWASFIKTTPDSALVLKLPALRKSTEALWSLPEQFYSSIHCDGTEDSQGSLFTDVSKRLVDLALGVKHVYASSVEERKDAVQSNQWLNRSTPSAEADALSRLSLVAGAVGVLACRVPNCAVIFSILLAVYPRVPGTNKTSCVRLVEIAVKLLSIRPFLPILVAPTLRVLDSLTSQEVKAILLDPVDVLPTDFLSALLNSPHFAITILWISQKSHEALIKYEPRRATPLILTSTLLWLIAEPTFRRRLLETVASMSDTEVTTTFEQLEYGGGENALHTLLLKVLHLQCWGLLLLHHERPVLSHWAAFVEESLEFDCSLRGVITVRLLVYVVISKCAQKANRIRCILPRLRSICEKLATNHHENGLELAAFHTLHRPGAATDKLPFRLPSFCLQSVGKLPLKPLEPFLRDPATCTPVWQVLACTPWHPDALCLLAEAAIKRYTPPPTLLPALLNFLGVAQDPKAPVVFIEDSVTRVQLVANVAAYLKNGATILPRSAELLAAHCEYWTATEPNGRLATLLHVSGQQFRVAAGTPLKYLELPPHVQRWHMMHNVQAIPDCEKRLEHLCALLIPDSSSAVSNHVTAMIAAIMAAEPHVSLRAVFRAIEEPRVASLPTVLRLAVLVYQNRPNNPFSPSLLRVMLSKHARGTPEYWVVMSAIGACLWCEQPSRPFAGELGELVAASLEAHETDGATGLMSVAICMDVLRLLVQLPASFFEPLLSRVAPALLHVAIRDFLSLADEASSGIFDGMQSGDLAELSFILDCLVRGALQSPHPILAEFLVLLYCLGSHLKACPTVYQSVLESFLFVLQVPTLGLDQGQLLLILEVWCGWSVFTASLPRFADALLATLDLLDACGDNERFVAPWVDISILEEASLPMTSLLMFQPGCNVLRRTTIHRRCSPSAVSATNALVPLCMCLVHCPARRDTLLRRIESALPTNPAERLFTLMESPRLSTALHSDLFPAWFLTCDALLSPIFLANMGTSLPTLLNGCSPPNLMLSKYISTVGSLTASQQTCKQGFLAPVLKACADLSEQTVQLLNMATTVAPTASDDPGAPYRPLRADFARCALSNQRAVVETSTVGLTQWMVELRVPTSVKYFCFTDQALAEALRHRKRLRSHFAMLMEHLTPLCCEAPLLSSSLVLLADGYGLDDLCIDHLEATIRRQPTQRARVEGLLLRLLKMTGACSRRLEAVVGSSTVAKLVASDDRQGMLQLVDACEAPTHVNLPSCARFPEFDQCWFSPSQPKSPLASLAFFLLATPVERNVCLRHEQLLGPEAVYRASIASVADTAETHRISEAGRFQQAMHALFFPFNRVTWLLGEELRELVGLLDGTDNTPAVQNHMLKWRRHFEEMRRHMSLRCVVELLTGRVQLLLAVCKPSMAAVMSEVGYNVARLIDLVAGRSRTPPEVYAVLNSSFPSRDLRLAVCLCRVLADSPQPAHWLTCLNLVNGMAFPAFEVVPRLPVSVLIQNIVSMASEIRNRAPSVNPDARTRENLSELVDASHGLLIRAKLLRKLPADVTDAFFAMSPANPAMFAYEGCSVADQTKYCLRNIWDSLCLNPACHRSWMELAALFVRLHRNPGLAQIDTQEELLAQFDSSLYLCMASQCALLSGVLGGGPVAVLEGYRLLVENFQLTNAPPQLEFVSLPMMQTFPISHIFPLCADLVSKQAGTWVDLLLNSRNMPDWRSNQTLASQEAHKFYCEPGTLQCATACLPEVAALFQAGNAEAACDVHRKSCRLPQHPNYLPCEIVYEPVFNPEAPTPTWGSPPSRQALRVYPHAIQSNAWRHRRIVSCWLDATFQLAMAGRIGCTLLEEVVGPRCVLLEHPESPILRLSATQATEDPLRALALATNHRILITSEEEKISAPFDVAAFVESTYGIRIEEQSHLDDSANWFLRLLKVDEISPLWYE